MQGSVFISLADLIEEKFGLEMWDKLLTEVKPESGGVYTSGLRYADEELFALVTKLAELSKIPIEQLIRSFGEYLFAVLYSNMPADVESDKGLRFFLLQVDSVIHKEVYRLYPDALLPEFEYGEDKPNELLMRYRSPRKLCVLCEGLLQGAANQFNETIHIDHSVCMHDGAEHCDLNITFAG